MKRGLFIRVRSLLFSLGSLGLGFVLTALPCVAQTEAPNAPQDNGLPVIPHEMIFDIVNFVLLVVVLVYLYRKYGAGFYTQRSESIRKSLEEGRKALEASQAQLAAAEEKLAHLEDEIAALKKRTEIEIAEERERTRKASAEDAERVLQHTKSQIQAATTAAKLELKDYVAEQALQQAESLVRDRLNEKSQQQLVNAFLADLTSKVSKN